MATLQMKCFAAMLSWIEGFDRGIAFAVSTSPQKTRKKLSFALMAVEKCFDPVWNKRHDGGKGFSRAHYTTELGNPMAVKEFESAALKGIPGGKPGQRNKPTKHSEHV